MSSLYKDGTVRQAPVSTYVGDRLVGTRDVPMPAFEAPIPVIVGGQLEEVPPQFSDLNKPTRDLFTKGYNFGMNKLDFKMHSLNGLSVNLIGEQRTDNNSTFATVESKFNIKGTGISVTEKFTTNNMLHLDVTAEDQGIQGSKVSLVSTYAPQTGKKTASLRTAFKRPRAHLTGDLDFDYGSPLAHASAVMSHQGVRVGAHLAYDTGKAIIVRNAVGLGYATGPYTIHATMFNGQEFEAGFHLRSNAALESAIKVRWNQRQTTANDSEVAVALKYNVDPYSVFRAKLDNRARLGLGYTQQLRPGLAATLSALVDTNTLRTGGDHHLGLGLEIEV